MSSAGKSYLDCPLWSPGIYIFKNFSYDSNVQPALRITDLINMKLFWCLFYFTNSGSLINTPLV